MTRFVDVRGAMRARRRPTARVREPRAAHAGAWGMGGQEARASGQPCVGLIEVGESGVLLPAVREAILADDAELASGY